MLDQAILTQMQEQEKLGSAIQLGVFLSNTPSSEGESATTDGEAGTTGDSEDADNAAQRKFLANDLKEVGTLAIVKSLSWTVGNTGQRQVCLLQCSCQLFVGIVSKLNIIRLGYFYPF